MPPDRSRAPRQDPVSCQDCRKKKLKCDREYPCSNCSARGKTCVFSGKRVSATSSRQSEADDAVLLRAENAAIRERLEKLERVVLSGTPSSSTHGSERTGHENVYPSPSVSAPPVETEVTQGYKEDFRWLEGMGTGENSRLPDLSPTFRIRVAPVNEISKRLANGGYHEHDIPLPSEEDAAAFVELHAARIDPAQHYTHVPTHTQNIARLYEDLRNGRDVEPSRTVFLLSILSTAACLWAFSEDYIPFYADRHAALNATYDWTRLTLDVLEHVRRSGSATVEAVQATMTIVFLLYHADGFSLKVRSLHGSAICLAKELGLHKTDAARNGLPPPKSQADVVDRELRRRVWWHLACTDWSLGVSCALHAGSYSISPKQMRVKKPRNISDEELSIMPADWEQPRSVPTLMSYFLTRITLGEISRRIADLDDEMELDSVPIGEIVAVDNEFTTALNDLPFFLRIDQRSLLETKHLEAEHPHLPLQRYVANIMLHARRCKFHAPFLLRAATDANYAPFRLECLRSARAVMQARTDLAQGDYVWLANSKMCGILHLFFYSVVVLVIDLCVHKTAVDQQARKAEIKEACKTLEASRHESRMAGRFVDSLMAILKKHRIRLQGQEAPDVDFADVGMPLGLATASANPDEPFEYAPSMDFDEIWHSYTDLDFGNAQDWDALMRDLDLPQ